jgi:uncharacterized protein
MRRFRRLPMTTVLGFEVPVATSRWSRLLGFALLAREKAGEGLLIPSCRSIHTCGMRFPLDLIFIDREGQVVELLRSFPPWKIVRCPEAAAVLELPSPEM